MAIEPSDVQISYETIRPEQIFLNETNIELSVPNYKTGWGKFWIIYGMI